MDHIAQNVIDVIRRGNFDSDLDKISEVIRERRKRVEQRKLHTLEEGQTVWITEQTRPTYLIGLEAEIIEINRARAVIKLKKGSVGRFGGERIKVYPHHITPVKPAYAR